MNAMKSYCGWFERLRNKRVSGVVKKMGISRLRRSKPNEVAVVADMLEPKLLKGVAVYVVRTRPDLLLQ
jgi:hypothetical protein